jgi:hypothetical protein
VITPLLTEGDLDRGRPPELKSRTGAVASVWPVVVSMRRIAEWPYAHAVLLGDR